MSKATGAAKARATVTHEGRTTKTVVEELPALIVDGVTYEFDPGAISARDEDDLAAQAKSDVSLSAILTSMENERRPQPLRDMAALMWLSLRQHGRAEHFGEVSTRLRLNSIVEMRKPGGDDEGEGEASAD